MEFAIDTNAARALHNVAASSLAQGQSEPDVSQTALDAAKETAREFEAMVLSELLAPLFETLGDTGLGNSGSGGSDLGAYGGMINEHFARAIAERGTIGIAERVLGSLVDLQMEASAERRPAQADTALPKDQTHG